jgi:signal transduction histidine kinase
MAGFKSITSRIITLHVIAISATSILMPLALYWLLSSTARDLQNRSLRDNADTIVAYLHLRANGTWALDVPAGFRELYSASYGRYAFAILDEAGHVLFASGPENAVAFPKPRLSDAPSFSEWTHEGSQFYGGIIPEEVGGRKVWVQVAQDLAHRDVLIDDIVASFFYRVGWITIPILLVLLVIDIAIFRRALRPVLNASDMAKTISPARIDLRLPTEQIPREILPLVNAVNQAFERLERGFTAQRVFTADAAHELRTPLTVLGARIDTLSDREVAQSLHGDIAGMTRIVNQLLESAELESLVLDATETADLHSVCGEVVALVAPLALAQGKEIALIGDSEPVWIKGNAGSLFQAVRNLADNAIRHTPPGCTVAIEVDRRGSVRVRDEGPGVPESERELIFRRFWRRDRRRPDSAGLGLSIVARVVEAHGGSITVTNGPVGGAVFALDFSTRLTSPQSNTAAA